MHFPIKMPSSNYLSISLIETCFVLFETRICSRWFKSDYIHFVIDEFRLAATNSENVLMNIYVNGDIQLFSINYWISLNQSMMLQYASYLMESNTRLNVIAIHFQKWQFYSIIFDVFFFVHFHLFEIMNEDR